jgi:hypothetical protein
MVGPIKVDDGEREINITAEQRRMERWSRWNSTSERISTGKSSNIEIESNLAPRPIMCVCVCVCGKQSVRRKTAPSWKSEYQTRFIDLGNFRAQPSLRLSQIKLVFAVWLDSFNMRVCSFTVLNPSL